jgi:hypothetical protein
MKAKFVNEDVTSVLKPKTVATIEKDFESTKIKDHFIVLKKSINELLNNDNFVFADFCIAFDRIKKNFIEISISDYLKKETEILFIVTNKDIKAFLKNNFTIELYRSHSGYSYYANLMLNGQTIAYTTGCQTMRTLKQKILKMIKENNVKI